MSLSLAEPRRPVARDTPRHLFHTQSKHSDSGSRWTGSLPTAPPVRPPTEAFGDRSGDNAKRCDNKLQQDVFLLHIYFIVSRQPPAVAGLGANWEVVSLISSFAENASRPF